MERELVCGREILGPTESGWDIGGSSVVAARFTINFDLAARFFPVGGNGQCYVYRKF